MISDDNDQRKSFLRMTNNEQQVILYDMLSYLRSEMAESKRDRIGLRNDFDQFKREAREYRYEREQKENGHGRDTLTTTQKIIAEMAKQFNFWNYFRDRILPTILTAICLGILYLVFGGKLP